MVRLGVGLAVPVPHGSEARGLAEVVGVGVAQPVGPAGHLPPDVVKKITCENAGKFYGLMN